MAEHGASAEEITDAVKAVWQMWAYAVTFHPSMGDLPLPDQTTKGDDAEEHLDHDQLLRLLSSRLSINEVQYTVTPLAAGGYAVQIIHIDQQWQWSSVWLERDCVKFAGWPFPGICWVSGAVGMLALRASRGSSLLRLRVDVPDQPIKMRLERFTAFLRAVTPNVHGGWAYAEITRKFTF
jgi:hypothetical protein